MIKALLFAMPDSVWRFDTAMLIPNLGIISVAGNVDPGVCDVRVADLLLVKRRWRSYALDALKKRSPDLVGLSCMSFQYHSAVALAKLIKTYDKNILTVMGGYHPTLMYDEMATSPESQFIDFIVRGEGEATFNKLVTAMNAGRGYDDIAGLSYKVGGVFRHNPPRSILSLETIQLPKRDARLIKKGFHSFGIPADAVETSRGCTFSCKFCSIRQMYGRNFRKYEISRIISDIGDAHEHGARAINFTDDNITLDLERMERLFEEIAAQKLNSIHYSVQASVRGIAHSARLVQKMADAGVKLVFLGIESVSKETLNFLRKESSLPDDTLKAVKYLRDNGIICIGGFIVGNPDDDEKSLKDTFDTAWGLRIDIPIFFILTPHMKTEIREELMAAGMVANADDVSSYHGLSANVRTKYLSPEEIDKMVEEMYDAYYCDPHYLKFNQIRKTYPLYFWKTVGQQFPSFALDLMKKKLRRSNSF